MAKLTSGSRAHLRESTFGLPSERKYPMPDASHAANAKSRATQMFNRGKLSASERQRIEIKANKVLSRGR